MKPETDNLRPVVTAALVSLALTLFLYGGALALPLYSDDVLQVPWVEATGTADFWRAVGPYRDYRPLHFTLWRLLYLLTGDLRPGLLHALNLAGHGLCGVLVALLASRWGKRSSLIALLAAAFFVAFPFAFDAVPWAIAFSYPLTTALALGALLAYLHARDVASLPHHLLSVVLTGLAGLAHEGGAAAGLTILLAEVVASWRGRRRLSPWPLANLAVSGLTLVAAVLVRPQGTSLHGLAWPDLAYSGACALQALTFPTAPLAGLLTRQGVSPALAVALVGLPALAAVGWGARRGLGVGPALLAAGWWALWCLPPLATLRFEWLSDAPRVFYPTAVGVALLWAGATGARRDRVCRAMVLAVACLVPAAWFVAGRMAFQRQVGNLLWEVIGTAEESGPLLVVNLPSRITPAGRFYPLGREGAVPLPPRVTADDLVTAHTGRSDAVFERAWGPVLPPLPYAVQPLGDPLTPDDLRGAGQVALVVYRPDGMGLEEAGAILPLQATDQPLARFGREVLLLSLSCTRAGPARVVLSIRWQVLGPVEGTPTVFAHLLRADGTLLAQADGDPLRGLYPFPLWQPSEVVRDVRVFDNVPTGAATVAVGVWDPAAGARWKAVGSDGEPLADDALRFAISEP